MFKEEDIQKMMKTLDLTREEAIEMMQDDLDIDRGEQKDFDLPAEKQKAVKEIIAVGTRKTGEKVKRERKPNPDKREIIEIVAQNLTRVCSENFDRAEGITVINPERQVDFIYKGVAYSVTLTAHRPPKADKGKA